jgi:hypothetical protein
VECLRRRYWDFLDDWRDLWVGCGDYDCLQEEWRVGGLELCGQFEYGSGWVGACESPRAGPEAERSK